MTKHKLNKRTRTMKRIQKGGDLLNPFTWFQGDDWGGWFKKATDTTSNLLNSANNTLGTAATNIASGAQSAVETAGKTLSTNIPLTSSPVEPVPNPEPIPEPMSVPEPISNPVPNPGPNPGSNPGPNPNLNPNLNPVQDLSIGGKRRRYTLKGKKNMKGGLGLTYYATPVSNMKVAEPTYWEVYANGTNQYNIKGGSKKKTRRSKKRRSKRRSRRV
jgi:hypothetical protein